MAKIDTAVLAAVVVFRWAKHLITVARQRDRVPSFTGFYCCDSVHKCFILDFILPFHDNDDDASYSGLIIKTEKKKHNVLMIQSICICTR